MDVGHGNFSVAIDDLPLSIGSSYNRGYQIPQSLFDQALEPGQHVINVTNLEDGKGMTLDFFACVERWNASTTDLRSSYTPLPDAASESSSPIPTTSQRAQEQATQSSHRLSTSAVVGIALALVAVTILFMLLVLHIRRRTQFDAHSPEPASYSHAQRRDLLEGGSICGGSSSIVPYRACATLPKYTMASNPGQVVLSPPEYFIEKAAL